VPDIGELGKLVDAWERSKFLFEPETTNFLRQLWLDAVTARHQQSIISGEADGDRQEAIKIKFSLAKKYLLGSPDDPDFIELAFKSMKIV
jgi:hypothetical protein